MWVPTSSFVAGLRPVWAGAQLAGRAFTVWTALGDNLFILFIHKALDATKPGDVLVVNGSGDTMRALIGDLIGFRAKALGIVGLVIDGAGRDTDALAELGLPVFARNVAPAGPHKNGPGRLGEPVAVGRGGRARRCRRRGCRRCRSRQECSGGIRPPMALEAR